MTQPPTETLAQDASPSTTGARGLLASLWLAVKGSTEDLATGPVDRAFLLLSVPMVLEMVMESVFALVDVLFVSHLGADAIATVGLTESMLTLLQTLPLGLSIGATALIARRIGQKDPERAASAAVQALGLGLALAVPLAFAGSYFARPLLTALGAAPGVIEHGAGYTRLMLASFPIIMLLFLISAILRGAGDAATSMRALWLANSVNIVLAPLFIFGLGPVPAMGVTGAALATTVGRSTGVVYQVYRLLKGSGRLELRRRHLRVETSTLRSLLKLSGGATLQSLLGMSSWLVLMRIVATFGSTALAGYTLAMRVLLFAQQPSWGLSHAAGTLVGQSLGAGDTDRAERAAWRASFYTLAFLGLVAVGFLLFAEPLIHRFTTDPEVGLHAVRCLRIVSCSLALYAFVTVLPHAFNGAGDTTTPTVVNALFSWGLQLPLAWVLSHPLGLGPSGAFIAIAVTYGALGLASAALFRRGGWKLRHV
ncbi:MULTISPECIES: MATE family efflux transporter [unclassified Corallococcus]|uniref:MATE family efflux transporter n=1 Tax=unclassified Corallococcus TaxID=2685029 RepID=UPI001A9015CF|nr:MULTISPECIES: MATE family efflux transporter [unclassified Corallococcus]MBN9681202.1 MATE family efflux transporter [Corallococcus sp. NCSPR001]WAS87217.1 MATE family efflux transporter [Corallococcus sp. NCRR]